MAYVRGPEGIIELWPSALADAAVDAGQPDVSRRCSCFPTVT
jgi:hypothetical protein